MSANGIGSEQVQRFASNTEASIRDLCCSPQVSPLSVV